MTAADILRETAADMRFLGAGSGPLSQAMDFAREISEEWGVRTRVSIDTPARTDCGTRLLWSIFEAATPLDATEDVMTPDEIRELRCECGQYVDGHYGSIWSSYYARRCSRSMMEALASALTERLADAWDECAREAHSLGWLHDPALGDVLERNPYRAHADSGRSRGSVSDERGAGDE